ncbi:hypothetical protein NEUTE1DRAFT_118103, partial [Neurospora tetrasperma FGSC 2508]
MVMDGKPDRSAEFVREVSHGNEGGFGNKYGRRTEDELVLWGWEGDGTGESGEEGLVLSCAKDSGRKRRRSSGGVGITNHQYFLERKGGKRTFRPKIRRALTG